MTNFLRRMLLKPLPSVETDFAYTNAMNVSGDLLKRMRDSSQSADPVRGVMADIWHQRHNVPFMVTVKEAVAEMKAPFEGTTARAPISKQPDRK